ncbi:hypothetical protein GBAR_LOCUS8496, partial [Geodia barretti]
KQFRQYNTVKICTVRKIKQAPLLTHSATLLCISTGNTDNTQTVSNATSGGNLIQASVWQTLTNSSIPSSSTLIKSSMLQSQVHNNTRTSPGYPLHKINECVPIVGAPTVTAGSTSAVPASLPGNSSLKTFKVLTAATSSVVLVVSIIAAVTLWIYRHQHKKKGQKLDKEYHGNVKNSIHSMVITFFPQCMRRCHVN